MKNKKFRKIAILVAVMMLVMSFSSTGFASWLDQTIKASYRNISVYVNGTMKQAKTATGAVVEPFIVDGTTYVPLRGIAEMLGYQVNFNPNTYRIDITGVDISALTSQLIQKDARIKELETLLANKTTYSLTDMQEDLVDNYTRFTRSVPIDDILVKGKTSDIELRVYVYLEDQTDLDAWYDAYDDGDVKTTLQKMVDDVLDEFPDAKVSGYVQDDYDDTKLVSFTVNRGVISLSKTSTTVSTLADLEDALYDEFKGSYGIEDFKIGGTKSVIEVDVLVDYDDWKALSSTKKTEAKNKVMDFIEDSFPTAGIDGLVISNDSYSETLSSFSN
ncbi:stalk domain-containing protein [Gudongella oleilytica]|jgi:hypothetical protein|uniref:stalk domain-containing protein n=1 Tax=Gudongella oleilytica TaxID=1582259 RepID=UPI000FF89E4A|nr:stalk domain-containing protein [Gudongella oleilytica]HMM69941.1 stalk domain-containing protein [Gudongella oleilytica]